MNKQPIDILSYIKTLFVTIIVAGLFSGAIIYYAQYDVINNATTRYNERALNEYIKSTVIIQNEDLESEHPEDYRIDIHLGYLHKVIHEYDKAEKYYKKAVDKAPIGIYKPLYELGCFYVERDRFDDAKNIIAQLPEKSDTPLIKFQSYLYRKLGDAYYNKGLYYDALQQYKTSLYYWDKLHTPYRQYINEVNQKIYQTTLNLADICVNSNKVQEAVDFLDVAVQAHPKDFNARYKLALASANVDPEKSYKYFKKLFDENPTKVDHTAYYKLLDNMSTMYEEEGDYIKAKLFAFRAKSLLDFVSENLIYPQDIDFKVTEVSLYNTNKKSKILIKYNLQNISNLPFKRLSMDVIYKLNGHEIETYTKSIVDSTNQLLVGDSILDSTIIPTVSKKYKSEDIHNLSAEIYLYKSKDRKLCVFNDKLFKEQVEIKQPKHCLDCQSYIKYFAHQILNIKDCLKFYKDSL